ncbi:helix-turn-helix domain-containing protein [Streptomyces sp. B22F1]|uniref:helix-turn-helix domain-containing protein n=1 Tax=Streptomyces sp. B22F1 TaxID=3153566 RepID=UPI00325C5818
MSRWKELPESLDPRVRQFVVQLRRLKDRSGLSLASLAGKTGISRSSWERYLNGKALPPPRAVEELTRVTGAEPTRLLVLRDVAAEAWRQQFTPDASARAEGADGAQAQSDAPAEQLATSTLPPAGDEGPPGVRKRLALTAVAVAALLGLGAGMLVATAWDDGGDGDGDGVAETVKEAADTRSPSPSSSPSPPADENGPYVFKAGKTHPCKVRRTDALNGRLGAGYSTTTTAVLAGPGWDVVEAQCLLDHHKLDPGPVDGVYGQQTIAAVAQLQKKNGLVADGIVGEHTWQVLRG